jgi:pimeloyl-ACP methyl ester carboxylesterase
MAQKFVYQPAARRRRRHLWVWLAVAIVLAGGASYYYGRYLPPELGGLPPVFRRSEPVGGKVLQKQRVATLAPHQIDNDAKVVYPNQTISNAKTAVEHYIVTYSSQDPRTGKEVQIKGRLYLPVTGRNLPVYVFGPGTTGPGPICAPSLERSRNLNWGRYDNHLAYYAGQGYAVAATDYNGRGEAEIHHYFVGEMEGRVMLDLARVMRKFEDAPAVSQSPAGDQVFFAGYSQGGHAALWADQIQATYAPDVKVAGVIGYAPATDLLKTFYDTGSGTASTWIPPYLYAAYDDYYGLKTPASTFFQEPIATTVIDDARSYCIDQVETKTGRFGTPATIAQIFQPEFLASLRNRTFPKKYPDWAGLMTRNLAGDAHTTTPKLMIAGQKDIVITASAQIELMGRLCRQAGAVAQLDLHPEVTHYTAMSVGRSRTQTWMEQVINGQRPPSNCNAYQPR